MPDLEHRIFSALATGRDATVDLAIALLRPFAGTPRRGKARPRTLTAPLALTRVFDALGDAASIGEQDRLIAPSDWSLIEGKLLFAEENQNVCEWACDPSGDDPSVYYKHHRSSAWAHEHIELAAFLLRFAIVETVFGASVSESAPMLRSEKLALLQARMRLIPLGDASWPEHPTRLFARGDALAFVSPNGPGASTVFVAAQEHEEMAFLGDLVDGDWD